MPANTYAPARRWTPRTLYFTATGAHAAMAVYAAYGRTVASGQTLTLAEDGNDYAVSGTPEAVEQFAMRCEHNARMTGTVSLFNFDATED